MKLFYFLFLGAFFSLPARSEENRILKGVAPIKPPLAYKLKDNITGSEIETIKTIGKRIGYIIDFKLEPWDNAIRDIEDGKFDFIINIEKKESIVNSFYFTAPTLPLPLVFYKRKKDNITFKYLHNLKQYKIGIIRDLNYRGEFQTLLESESFDTYSIFGNNPDLQGLLKVATKKIDLYPCLNPVCEYLVRTNKDTYQEMLSLDFIDKPVGEKKLYRVAFPKFLKDSEKLKDEFNAEIVNFIGSSAHRAILQKYGINYDLN